MNCNKKSHFDGVTSLPVEVRGGAVWRGVEDLDMSCLQGGGAAEPQARAGCEVGEEGGGGESEGVEGKGLRGRIQ